MFRFLSSSPRRQAATTGQGSSDQNADQRPSKSSRERRSSSTALRSSQTNLNTSTDIDNDKALPTSSCRKANAHHHRSHHNSRHHQINDLCSARKSKASTTTGDDTTFIEQDASNATSSAASSSTSSSSASALAVVASKPLMSSTSLKNAGNKLCALHKYEEAISCYTRAIMRNPNEPIFFSNRALCNLKLAQWQLAIQDSRQALELDPNLIKAHFFLGQALAETECFDEALKHLQRAHELSRDKKLNFGDDITHQIRLTKRRRWNKIEEANNKLEEDLHTYLLELLRKDRDEKIAALGQQQQRPLPTASTSSMGASFNGTAGAADTRDSQLVVYESELKSKCDTYAEKLRNIFNSLALQRRKRDVPDYLCGKISFEIMQDPVVTPSGITYDRRDIEEHLKRVGHFDPVTRQPLRPEHLVPNLVMKEVVDAYLNENEWAPYY